MRTVVPIVEGDGEVQAVPVLLRRPGTWLTPANCGVIARPIRVRRDRFLNRPEEFSSHLELAAAKAGAAGWVLVLLDADDDCPARLSATVKERGRAAIPHADLSVVLANREYEAWFVASARALDGHRGFRCPTELPPDPEAPRNPKAWMDERIAGGRYRETTDQPAFSAAIELEEVHRTSRSFRKLCAEWTRHMGPGDAA